MHVIKKLNNNAAVCIVSNGEELIALGKGIGFPKTPYELTDLSQISQTFYSVNPANYNVLKEIPEEIIEVSAEIVSYAKSTLNKDFSPSLFITLADHINFAIIRQKNYRSMKLKFSYEVEQFYPQETKVAQWAVHRIEKKLNVYLPESEITAITMHFINAEEEAVVTDTKLNQDTTIDAISRDIEDYFGISLDRKSFSYQRFVSHLRFLLSRLESNEQFVEADLYPVLKETYPKATECVRLISHRLAGYTQMELTDSEKSYLIIHLQRILDSQKRMGSMESKG